MHPRPEGCYFPCQEVSWRLLTSSTAPAAILELTWPAAAQTELLLPRQWRLAPAAATAAPANVLLTNEVAGVSVRADGVSAARPFLYNATSPGRYTVTVAGTAGPPLLTLRASCHEGFFSDVAHRCRAITVIHQQWRASMEAADITAQWRDRLEFVGSMRGVLLRNAAAGVNVNTVRRVWRPYNSRAPRPLLSSPSCAPPGARLCDDVMALLCARILSFEYVWCHCVDFVCMSVCV